MTGLPPPRSDELGLASDPMDRIAIIGCGGSGKSTIARQLGRLVDAPVTHLDGLYYDGGWNPLPQDRFAVIQQELVDSPRWIIEGNYASTLHIRLAAADTVIFLDLPASACLWGIVQRRWRYRGGQHPEVGVYDRITWPFISYILGYRSNMRPRITQLIADHAAHARFVTLASRRQASWFLEQIYPGTPARL